MASRVASSTNMMRVWVTKQPAVWPIIGCMGFGVAWVSFIGGRFLTVSPDTHWVQADRGNLFRTNFSEGKAWKAHRNIWIKSRADVAESSVFGMETINRWVGGTLNKPEE